MSLYTTWGSVRQGCGHPHRTQRGAEKCRDRDSAACAKLRGYSDRTLRQIDRKKDATDYRSSTGPGVPVASWGGE